MEPNKKKKKKKRERNWIGGKANALYLVQVRSGNRVKKIRWPYVRVWLQNWEKAQRNSRFERMRYFAAVS